VELPETAESTSPDGPSSEPSTSPVTSAPATGATPPAASGAETGRALARLADAKPVVVVTCGATATLLALESIPKTPVVFCTVPNALDTSFLAQESPHRKRIAGTTTDVAPQEQVEWIHKLCPNLKNLGVLQSARSKRTMEAIRPASAAKGIAVVAIDAGKDEFPKSIELLSSKGCEGVLMLPDAGVYNSANVQRLLLWGIRQKKPVFAFSSNIVKAGAFAGQYPDMQASTLQLVDLVDRIVKGGDAGKIGLEYPRKIDTAINERIADMIGISIDGQTLGAASVRYGKGQ
jgi:ABC-type uncharacterized transport system substrate-binding protein